MANPLSLPVALAGTLAYMAMAGFTEFDPGLWFVYYVDVLAFAVLTLGSLVGIGWPRRGSGGYRIDYTLGSILDCWLS